MTEPQTTEPTFSAGTYLVAIDAMTCSSCVARVETAIRSVSGVSRVAVNLVEQIAQVEGGKPQAVLEAIRDQGYGAQLQQPAVVPGAADRYTLSIDAMTCSSCVARVEKAIASVPGVADVSVNLIDKTARVRGGEPQQVIESVGEQGYGARLEPVQALVQALVLELGDGVGKQQRQGAKQLLQFLPGVSQVLVDADGTLTVTSTGHPADLLLALRGADYQAYIREQYTDPYAERARETSLEIGRAWRRALLAGLVGVGLMAGNMSGLLPVLDGGAGSAGFAARGFWGLVALLCLFTMWYSGRQYYTGAWKLARHWQTNMDTLVALGTGAAWLSSVIILAAPGFVPGGGHLYLDTSVLILAFLQLGHALETRAKRNTRAAISSLVHLAPRNTWVVRSGGEEVELPVSLLRLGDRIRVKPGASIAIDGEVVEGRSSVDESMLTGEPMSVRKAVGDPVTGGSINGAGTFLFQVTRLGEDTTLAHIVRMVKQAQLSKPPIGRMVDRVAAVFVPIVLVIALLTALVWYLVGPEPSGAFALNTGIAVLVIACPCALGLATPIAIMVGTGRAAAFGVLIRNGEALQSASGLTHLVVDKTGTLTQGCPSVTEIATLDPTSREQALGFAASLEIGSEHPLAEAIVGSARAEGVTPLPAEAFLASPGRGVEACIAGRLLRLGNRRFLDENQIGVAESLAVRAEAWAARGITPVYLADEQQALAVLGLTDPLRSDTPAAVDALQALGVEIVLCTGDLAGTAHRVAGELGITRVHSEVTPADKLEVVRSLQAQGFKVGMAGDGVNDAPALAQADVGFAIGSGTDVAIENADITLAGDSLASIDAAIGISRATIGNIKQNLFGAFIYNVIGIPLAAGVLYPLTGWLLHPAFASAAMALSSVTVVTNANRLRLLRPGLAVNARPASVEHVESEGEKIVSEPIALKVEGMTCNHCVAHVTKALEGVTGVSRVAVNLDSGSARVEGEATGEALIAAVKQAGYEAALAG